MSEKKAKEERKEAAQPPYKLYMDPPTEGHPATLHIRMELNRLNPHTARGLLVSADDIVAGWYDAQQEALQKLQKPKIILAH